MRYLLTVLVSLFLIGCSEKEKLVELSEQTLPKTASIEVDGIVEGLKLITEGTTMRVEKSTFPVKVAGAGVFISENNHVLTCDHLFTLPVITTVTVCNYSGECAQAEILFREYNLDLALLRVDFKKKSNFARLGDPRDLRVGQEVIAIGNPLGFAFSVSHGIISALNRDVGVYNMTQSDTFINPGNSGGGLFNLAGELIGINSRMVPPVNAAIFTGLGFSVQSGQIVEFLTRFRGLDKTIPKYDLGYWTSFLAALGWGD